MSGNGFRNAWILAVALATSMWASAQTYPAKPVKVVVPFTPAGNVDVVARLVNQKLEAELGQSVVTENLAGASGSIGAATVARAPADGYTLLANSSIHLILPGVMANLPYNALNDFVPLSQITEVPMALVVSGDMPVKTHAEFVAWAKAQKQAIDYATFMGSAGHLAAELWKEQTGVPVFLIPYKAGTSATTDVIAGRVPFQFEALFAASGLIKSGKLRALAHTGSKRVAAFPDVPTFAELGMPSVSASTWHGYWAPKGTPKPVIDRLGAALVKVAHMPEVRDRIDQLGGRVVGSTPAEFADFSQKEYQRWGALLRRSGIEPK